MVVEVELETKDELEEVIGMCQPSERSRPAGAE
jgi:hypothetical protein